MDMMAVAPMNANMIAPGNADMGQAPCGGEPAILGDFSAMIQQWAIGSLALGTGQSSDSQLPQDGEMLTQDGNPVRMLSPEEVNAFRAMLTGSSTETEADQDTQDILSQLAGLMQQIEALLQQAQAQLQNQAVTLDGSIGDSIEGASLLSPQEFDLALQDLNRQLEQIMGELAGESMDSAEIEQQGDSLTKEGAENTWQILSLQAEKLQDQIQSAFQNKMQSLVNPAPIAPLATEIPKVTPNQTNVTPEKKSLSSPSGTELSSAETQESLNPAGNLQSVLAHSQGSKHQEFSKSFHDKNQSADSAKSTQDSALQQFTEVAYSDIKPEAPVVEGAPVIRFSETTAIEPNATQDITKLNATDRAERAEPKSNMLQRMEEHVAVRQVAGRIQFMIRDGESRAILRLDPPELGHIEIQMDSKPGELKIHMTVENDSVKQAMESSVVRLRESMESHQIKIEKLEVEVSQGKSEAQAQAEARNQSQGRRHSRGANHGTGFADITLETPQSDTGRRLGYNTMELIA